MRQTRSSNSGTIVTPKGDTSHDKSSTKSKKESRKKESDDNDKTKIKVCVFKVNLFILVVLLFQQ
jgi:hypothetical protein